MDQNTHPDVHGMSDQELLDELILHKTTKCLKRFTPTRRFEVRQKVLGLMEAGRQASRPQPKEEVPV